MKGTDLKFTAESSVGQTLVPALGISKERFDELQDATENIVVNDPSVNSDNPNASPDDYDSIKVLKKLWDLADTPEEFSLVVYLLGRSQGIQTVLSGQLQ